MPSFILLPLLFMFIHIAKASENLEVAVRPNDPSSFARPELVAVTHIDLKLSVNFDKKILEGHAILDAVRIEKTADTLILDVHNLTLINIKNCQDDSKLEYSVGETVAFGSKLSIKLPNVPESEDSNMVYKIEIQYETSPKAPALQWLDSKQTSGGKHPYVFSLGEPIQARSMLPCQDTPSVKATYSAEITAPKWATVLMSALHKGIEDVDQSSNISKFHQPVPIVSYLIAIAVGSLVSKRIGPRSSVWAEQELIKQSAYEFGETDTILRTAEKICGPYVWGVYDLLLVPPSFSFGGMENPCLTFMSPTLLAGDRSLAGSIIAREITHSWTGNMVTNVNFGHYWLTEGFTTFIQYKIDGRMFGEKFRQFDALMGLSKLKDSLKSLTPEFTKLVLNLDGLHPGGAFSHVPYMKGHTFLYYLEELLGGPKEFEPFLRSYIETFKYKSIVTSDWKNYLYKYFSNKTQILDSVDWDTWLNKPGMPPVIPNYDTDLLKPCTKLAKQWISWDKNTAFSFKKSDITNLTVNQRIQFLTVLFEDDTVLPIKKLKKMQKIYGFDSLKNSGIQYIWIRLALKSRWQPKVAEALDFVSKTGRTEYVRPIYRDLYAWKGMRQRTIDAYIKIKDQMMYVTAGLVRSDLHLVRN